MIVDLRAWGFFIFNRAVVECHFVLQVCGDQRKVLLPNLLAQNANMPQTINPR